MLKFKKAILHGEHVSEVYWSERKIHWYLGVVISSTHTMRSVSHLRRTEEDIGWVFTETVDIHDADRPEVLTRHVEVKYNCEEIIGCRFENSEMIIVINSELVELSDQWY